MSSTRWPAAVAAAAILTTGVACDYHYGAKQQASPAPPPTATPRPTTANVSAQDKAWLAATHQGNVAEIEAGQLAQDKSGSAQIQSEGARLVADHMRLDQSLVALAEKVGADLPSGPTAEQAAQQQQLGALTGSEFDNQLIADLITGHQQAIAATRTQVAHGTNPEVVALAQQALPVMEKHLNMLKKSQH